MEPWVKNMARFIGVIVGVIGIAGFLFSLGSILGLLMHSFNPPPVDPNTMPGTLTGVFLFGVAAGGGITSYILLGFIKERKNP